MAGHMMPALEPAHDDALAHTPTDELLQLPLLTDDAIANSGAAYAMSKRANHLRVQAAAVTWGDRGARINSISPGIILTPLARRRDERPRRRRLPGDDRQVRRGARRHPDEVATAAGFLLGPDAAFITGTDLLMDGGVIAALRAGRITVNVG